MNLVHDRYTKARYDQNFEQCGFNMNHGVLSSNFNKHTHDFNEAAIIISGTAKHVVGDFEYPIKRGDVFVIKGDVVHEYTDVNNLELIDIMYFPNIFMSADLQLSSLPGFRSLFIFEPEVRAHNHYPFTLTLENDELDYAVTVSDFIIQEFAKKTQNYSVVVRLSLFALLAYLSVKYVSNTDETQASAVLSQAIWFMQRNMATQIRISDIASQLYISTRHLCRLFNEYFGCTPGEYLLDIRIKHALILLTKHNLKVAEVSANCGFSDPSYFARVFKKVYGVTPNQAKLLDW